MERLVEQMKEKEGIKERLKVEDMMEWVRRLNQIRKVAEEVVLIKDVYQEEIEWKYS